MLNVRSPGVGTGEGVQQLGAQSALPEFRGSDALSGTTSTRNISGKTEMYSGKTPIYIKFLKRSDALAPVFKSQPCLVWWCTL